MMTAGYSGQEILHRTNNFQTSKPTDMELATVHEALRVALSSTQRRDEISDQLVCLCCGASIEDVIEDLRAENAALLADLDDHRKAGDEHEEWCNFRKERDKLRERVRELVIHVQTLEEALKGD